MTDVVLDKKRCKIMRCEYTHIRHILKEFHYKGTKIGGGISVCFVMLMDNNIVGGSVLGSPRHEGKYPGCIDIRRMACLDSSPKNSESYFLGQIIKWIKYNTNYTGVLSYSDKTVGHEGTIYKASNFDFVGETSETKYVIWNGETYHPRSLSIDRDYSVRLREAIKTGEAKLLTGKPKKIWMYNIPKKRHVRKSFYVPHIGTTSPTQIDMFN